MHFRDRKRDRKPQAGGRSGRLAVESLTPRILLNADLSVLDMNGLYDAGSDPEPLDLDRLERMIVHDSIKEGYGQADPIFSDPSTWDASHIEEIKLQLENYDSSLFEDASIQSESLYDVFSQSTVASDPYILYLDFDGETVYSRSGDFWLGSTSVTVPAYDLGRYGWSGYEQESIESVTQFVREDYAAYNVEVTTTKPAGGEYTTIYVGGGNDWFYMGSGVIGVATYDIGNADPSNYGFAFSDELGLYQSYSGGDPLVFSQYLANLISHEAAHTFGANHVDDTSAMMNPYLPLAPVRQSFGEGDIPSSAQRQDTQSLLGENLGYAHGADDYSNLFAGAFSIQTNTAINGLLERRDDQDLFCFSAQKTGLSTIELVRSEYGNLNAVVSVYDSQGEVLVQSGMNGNSGIIPLEVDVQAGQSYWIGIGSQSQQSSGSYSLSVTSVLTPAQIAVTDSQGQSEDGIIDFGSVQINEQSNHFFTIYNSGDESLVISELTTDAGFTLGTVSLAGSGDDLAIEPGQEFTVEVSFQPGQVGFYQGVVTIVSNDPLGPVTELALSGYGESPQPDIVITDSQGHISSQEVSFGNVATGGQTEQTLILRNDGAAVLDLYHIETAAPFVIENIDLIPDALNPGQQFAIIISMEGTSHGTVEGQLLIVTNDPDEPTEELRLWGQVVQGELGLYDGDGGALGQTINFGTVYRGEDFQEVITLVNEGDGPLNIGGIQLQGSGFDLDIESQSNLLLMPGQVLSIPVHYSPLGIEDAEAIIEIQSDDPEHPLQTISLIAMGRDDALQIVECDGTNDGIINAGTMQIGEQELIPVWNLTNQGHVPLTVTLSHNQEEALQLAGPETLVLQAGEVYTVSMVCSTESAIECRDILTLQANDFHSTSSEVAIVTEFYAVVSQGNRYRFVDHSGDLVTISLRGPGQAEIRLGTPDQPDIDSIELNETTKKTSLAIQVAGGGSTEINRISGQGPLDSLLGRNVDLHGQGLDLAGGLNRLQLNSISEEATIQAERFDRIVLNDLLGRIEASQGDINQLLIREGNLEGQVYSQGSLGRVNIAKGDLSGSVIAEYDINQILLGKGDLTGTIQSGGTIDSIRGYNIRQANLYAQHQINKLQVKGDMIDSFVEIGYQEIFESNNDPELSSQEEASSELSTSPSQPQDSIHAELGMIQVRGLFSDSVVAVGVRPDQTDPVLSGQASSATGHIGRVDLKQVDMTSTEKPFGIIAKDSMDKVRINQKNVSTDFCQDPFFACVL